MNIYIIMHTVNSTTASSPESSSSVIGGAVGGALIGVLVGVVVIIVCMILVFVKYRSKKGLRIDDQGGAAFGNAVYDGGTILYNYVVACLYSACSTGDDLLQE